jgi:hypothetical protein
MEIDGVFSSGRISRGKDGKTQFETINRPSIAMDAFSYDYYFDLGDDRLNAEYVPFIQDEELPTSSTANLVVSFAISDELPVWKAAHFYEEGRLLRTYEFLEHTRVEGVMLPSHTIHTTFDEKQTVARTLERYNYSFRILNAQSFEDKKISSQRPRCPYLNNAKPASASNHRARFQRKSPRRLCATSSGVSSH